MISAGWDIMPKSFSNEGAITRLTGAIQMEHFEEWAVQRTRDMAP